MAPTLESLKENAKRYYDRGLPAMPTEPEIQLALLDCAVTMHKICGMKTVVVSESTGAKFPVDNEATATAQEAVAKLEAAGVKLS